MPSDPAPAGWDRVAGQERVTSLLRAAIRTNRLAHAYLFSGPEGSGADAAAVELARAWLCAAGGEGACGGCRECRQTAGLLHPNLHLVFPLPAGRSEQADDDPLEKLTPQEVEAVQKEIARKAADPYHPISVPRATQIRLNSIRTIRRRASFGSYDGGRSAFLILDAALMTTEAANALLKTLEEPPPGALFVLTTSDPDALPPTVTSRCQHVRFDPLPEEAVQAALVARYAVAPAEAAIAARLCGGNLAAAVRLAAGDLAARNDAAVELLRSMLHRTPAETAGSIRDAAAAGREEAAATLLLLQSWIRDAMLVSAGREPGPGASDAGAMARFVRQYPSLDYAAVSDAIDRAVSDLRRNVYIPIVLHALRVELRRAAQAAAGADR